MPVLPRYGWLFHCEECTTVTSRLTIVKHKRKTKSASVCLACRETFIKWLLCDFESVIIREETIGSQVVDVS